MTDMQSQERTEPLVSIVIPTRNGARRLPIVLDALSRQTLPRDRFEIVVGDDGSTDDTTHVAESYPGVRVVQARPGVGCPGMSNRIVAASSAPVIAFTDDDTVPAPDWLERGLARLEASRDGLVAGHVELSLSDPPSLAELVDLGRGYLDQESYAAEGYAATANAWVRRDVLERLGGFDERLLSQGHDRDFGERATLAGLRFEYAADVVVQHPARARARDLARVSFRQGRNFPEFRRHSVGRLRELRPAYRQLRYLRPWGSVWGLARVRHRGYGRGLREPLGMWLMQYACLQLPLAAGSALADARELRARLASR
jgi:GT2 family glycosyltransferase